MSVKVAKVTSATMTAREFRSDMAGVALPLFQQQASKRWNREAQRLIESVRGDRLRVDAAAVADVTAAVGRSIAVQELHIEARMGHADAVLSAHDRREVEDHRDTVPAVSRVEQGPHHAVFPVGSVNAAETLPVSSRLI